MFFGKYLLENGVVTSEQLLDAIVLQMESLPSLVKVIRKNKLLNCDEIIEIVVKSVDERKNILDLITEMEIFSKEKIDKLMEERRSMGKGLCEILVNEGHASSMMLNEYVGRYVEQKISSDESNADGFLGFDFKGEFVKVLDGELLEYLNEEIGKVSAGEIEQHIFNIGKDVALLATVSNMGKLDHVVDIVQIWLDVLEKSKGVSDKKYWSEVGSGLKNMVNLIWDMREHIVREGSVKKLIEDKEWKAKYNNGIRRAEYLLEEYENRKVA